MNLLRTFAAILTFALCFNPPGARSQSVDDIVNKHIEALGGKDKLLSIKSVYQEGVAVLQNGMEIDSKVYKVDGKLYRNEISFGMGNVIVIATPTQGWSQNPRSGGNFEAMKPEQVKALQPQLDLSGPFVNYAAKGNKVELVGKDTVNGKECYKLKVTFPSGSDASYSIDETTYYILRETRKGGGMGMGGGGGQGAGGGQGGGMGGGQGGQRRGNGELIIEYADYQKTPEGFIFPMTIIAGNFNAKTSVEKLEINKPIDDVKLSKPQ